MRLEQTNYDNSETGCCARLDTALWDDRELSWTDKPFLKDHIRAFLHIPINFGSVISRDHAAMQQAEAYPEEPFWITDEVSPWGSDIYLAIDKVVPNAGIAWISGKFLSKVFEGPYRDIGKWCHEMEEHVSRCGQQVKKLYFYYATCPKCAKYFGKNQVVLLAQIE